MKISEMNGLLLCLWLLHNRIERGVFSKLECCYRSYWSVYRHAKRQTEADLLEVCAAAYNPGTHSNEAGELAHYTLVQNVPTILMTASLSSSSTFKNFDCAG